MPHWRLFYHLVWATRDREPLLESVEAERVLGHTLIATCEELHVIVHAIGTMPDHVHLACTIPPVLAIVATVKRLKGASSHRLNQTAFAAGEPSFAWQAEYGAYSLTENALPKVIAYVRDQKARHAGAGLWVGFEPASAPGPTRIHPARLH